MKWLRVLMPIVFALSAFATIANLAHAAGPSAAPVPIESVSVTKVTPPQVGTDITLNQAAPASVLCAIGHDVFALRYEAQQGRFWMDDNLANQVKRFPTYCVGSFAAKTSLILNSNQGIIKADGQLVQARNDLRLTVFTFEVWYQADNPSNGFDAWILGFDSTPAPVAASAPSTAGPPAQAASVASGLPDRPYGSCAVNGRHRDMEWDLNKALLYMDPWVKELQASGGECHIQAGDRLVVVEYAGTTTRLQPGEDWFYLFKAGDGAAGASARVQ